MATKKKQQKKLVSETWLFPRLAQGHSEFGRRVGSGWGNRCNPITISISYILNVAIAMFVCTGLPRPGYDELPRASDFCPDFSNSAPDFPGRMKPGWFFLCNATNKCNILMFSLGKKSVTQL